MRHLQTGVISPSCDMSAALTLGLLARMAARTRTRKKPMQICSLSLLREKKNERGGKEKIRATRIKREKETVKEYNRFAQSFYASKKVNHVYKRRMFKCNIK